MGRVNHMVYGVYRGDVFLAVGLMDEVIEATGIDKKSLQQAAAPSHKGRRERCNTQNGLIVVRVGIEETMEDGLD